jgi:CheY-like chemotaxis protein/HPt (histidine-containing phosphotransfer) domain-containing protein
MGEIGGTPTGSSAVGPLVLVVDDDGSNRLVAIRMLERLGYAGRTATDGVEALREVETGGIGLILVDCRMPTLDGFATTRELRRREAEARSGSRTPVVAMTASATNLDREACAAAGMDDYLTKPVMMASLASILERWLGATPSGDADPQPDISMSHDETALARLRHDVGDEAADRFVATFLAGLGAREAAIGAALRAGSAEGVREAAHALRSPSAAVGATELSSLCARLEAEGRAGGLPPLEVLDELALRCAAAVGSLGDARPAHLKRPTAPTDGGE